MKRIFIILFMVTTALVLSACENGTNEENPILDPFDINDLSTCIADMETANDQTACEVVYRQDLFKDYVESKLDSIDYPEPRVLSAVSFTYHTEYNNISQEVINSNLKIENIPALQSSANYTDFKQIYDAMYTELSGMMDSSLGLTLTFKFTNESTFSFAKSVGGDGFSSAIELRGIDETMTDLIDIYEHIIIDMSTDTTYNGFHLQFHTDEYLVFIDMWLDTSEWMPVIDQKVDNPSLNLGDLETLIDDVMAQTSLIERSNPVD